MLGGLSDAASAMVSIFKGLWGRLAGGGAVAPAKAQFDAVDYNGYRIRPAPYQAAGGYQTAGVIEKDFADGMKEHSFVRAETHPRVEEAANFAIAKAKQIIDEQGDRIFVKR
jgi:hypothetical protein